MKTASKYESTLLKNIFLQKFCQFSFGISSGVPWAESLLGLELLQPAAPPQIGLAPLPPVNGIVKAVWSGEQWISWRLALVTRNCSCLYSLVRGCSLLTPIKSRLLQWWFQQSIEATKPLNNFLTRKHQKWCLGVCEDSNTLFALI